MNGTAPWQLERLDPVNPGLFCAPPGLYVPPYRAAQVGDWRIEVMLLAANIGFWTDRYPMSQIAVLMGPQADREDANTWMSTTAFELESQVIGLEAAHGTTVVFGFGLGWLAVNAAVRDAVERVIVVERDPSIIALSERSGVFEGLQPEIRGKIEIVQGDALEWRADGPVDTLQADIWPRMFGPSNLPDARRMQDNVRAERIYVWGQEVEIWRHARNRLGPEARLDWPTVRAVVEEDVGLPLILPDWPDYPERIMAMVRHFGPESERPPPR